MGYYSEIAIGMLYTDYERLRKELLSHSEIYNILDWAEIYKSKAYDGTDIVTIHWDSIKWYGDESFDIVDEFLDTVPHHKSVIGEDITDNEEFDSEDWFYDSEVYIERKIVGYDRGERI